MGKDLINEVRDGLHYRWVTRCMLAAMSAMSLWVKRLNVTSIAQIFPPSTTSECDWCKSWPLLVGWWKTGREGAPPAGNLRMIEHIIRRRWRARVRGRREAPTSSSHYTWPQRSSDSTLHHPFFDGWRKSWESQGNSKYNTSLWSRRKNHVLLEEITQVFGPI